MATTGNQAHRVVAAHTVPNVNGETPICSSPVPEKRNSTAKGHSRPRQVWQQVETLPQYPRTARESRAQCLREMANVTNKDWKRPPFPLGRTPPMGGRASSNGQHRPGSAPGPSLLRRCSRWINLMPDRFNFRSDCEMQPWPNLFIAENNSLREHRARGGPGIGIEPCGCFTPRQQNGCLRLPSVGGKGIGAALGRPETEYRGSPAAQFAAWRAYRVGGKAGLTLMPRRRSSAMLSALSSLASGGI
jgi:hypothetical protein